MNPKYLQQYFVALVRLIACSAFTFTVNQVCAYEYQLKGRLEYLIGENITPIFVRSFELAVSNCHWSVKISGMPESEEINYYEVMHDGEAIYCYTAFNASVTNSGNVNRGVAIIERGEVPPENGTFANYIWASFASGCYFNKARNNQLAPLWMGKEAHRVQVKANWRLTSRPPQLPNQVEYFQGAGLLPSPFSDGWKAAELTTLAVTNIHELAIPLAAVYTQFKPSPSARTATDLEKQFQVVLKVVSVISSANFPIGNPRTQGITLVEERRLLTQTDTSNLVVYASTADRLPASPEEAALRRQRNLGEESPKAGSDKTIMVGLTLLFSSALLALALRSLIKPNKQTT